MSKKAGEERGPWKFQLLRRCDEVDSRLGRLYESWNTVTGRPALTLFPHDTVEWQPSGPWQGWISFEPGPDCVSLEWEPGISAEQLPQCVNILTLLSEAGQGAEDSPQVQAHFEGGPPSRLERWRFRARRMLNSRGAWAAAGFAVLALGLGFWWGRTGKILEFASLGLFRQEQASGSAPALADMETQDGRWVELEKKSPCLDGQAEYEGGCYLPMAKKKPLPGPVEP